MKKRETKTTSGKCPVANREKMVTFYDQFERDSFKI